MANVKMANVRLNYKNKVLYQKIQYKIFLKNKIIKQKNTFYYIIF